MMIAVSLFTIVMLISSNMFLQSIDSQARAISSKDIQESLNFSLTILTNEMSGALVDPTSCDAGCVDPTEFFCITESGGALHFKNSSGNCVSYSRLIDSTTGANVLSTGDGINNLYLTPNNINISALNFSAVYMDDATYPIARVTVSLTGESLARETHPESMTVQTTIAVGQ